MTADVSALTWRALVGDYPNTHALVRGQLGTPPLRLEFADVAVPHKAFRRVVRDLEFDVAELPLMTFLMAKALGKPLVLLPVVVFARNPLQFLVCDASRRRLTPADLRGRRIGVRSYTTTTAAWIRGLLEECFGVDAAGIEWITLEDSHVAEFVDFPFVRRAPGDGRLDAMLLAGEIDAAIVDPVPPDPAVVPVVPDHARVIEEWRRRHRAVTINHMIVVRESLARSHPDLVGEVVRLFDESQRASGAEPDVPRGPLKKIEALRPSLEIAIEYAKAQGLIQHPLRVADLFALVEDV